METSGTQMDDNHDMVSVECDFVRTDLTGSRAITDFALVEWFLQDARKRIAESLQQGEPACYFAEMRTGEHQKQIACTLGRKLPSCAFPARDAAPVLIFERSRDTLIGSGTS